MIRHNEIEIKRYEYISVRGKTITFGPQAAWVRPCRRQNRPRGQNVFKVIEALLLVGSEGLTAVEIYNITHGDREDGGTEGGPGDAQVWMWQMPFRSRCAKLGIKLVTRRHQSRTRYALRVV